MRVRRGSVLEAAAATRGVNDRTCCNVGIIGQLFPSIGIGGRERERYEGGGTLRLKETKN